ncbi:UNKNOWN [Stylonychia lemnae]|uniref:Uncharacterized protein n=1 Tax=Stylonychia lemnae TaxID=5949 RepID=A0A078AKH4_STYLE|nr:UNKNOWN [Stylonychia lemnae]|eukprot:CDW81932.1 UNKNOWN [Stylonychia lemnae]
MRIDLIPLKKQGFGLNTYNTKNSSDTNKVMKVFTKLGQQYLLFIQQQQLANLMNTPLPNPSLLKFLKMSLKICDPKNKKELICLHRKSIALRHSYQTSTILLRVQIMLEKYKNQKQEQRVSFKSKIIKISEVYSEQFHQRNLPLQAAKQNSRHSNLIPLHNGDHMQINSSRRFSIASQISLKKTFSNDSSTQEVVEGGKQ